MQDISLSAESKGLHQFIVINFLRTEGNWAAFPAKYEESSPKELNTGGLLEEGPMVYPEFERNQVEVGDKAPGSFETILVIFPFELRELRQVAATCPHPW